MFFCLLTTAFKEITKLGLTLPAPIGNLSPSMEKVLQESIVALSSGKEHRIFLEFDDGETGETRDFAPLIPLTTTAIFAGGCIHHCNSFSSTVQMEPFTLM